MIILVKLICFNDSFVVVPHWLMTEYVYDAKLRRAMNLDKSSATAAVAKSNPDDDLF